LTARRGEGKRGGLCLEQPGLAEKNIRVPGLVVVGVARICSSGYKSRSRSGRYSPLAIGDLDSDIGQN